MHFALSEEQAELASTVRSLLDKKASPRVDDPALWSTLAEEIGVAALAIPEEHDGIGATFFETAVVLEELGRAVTPSPLLATTIATHALLAGGSDDAKQRLLPRIAAGEVATIALADGPVLEADRAAIVLAVVGNDLVEVTSPGATWVESMDQTLHLATLASTAGTPIGDGAAARRAAELVAAASVAALAVGLADHALRMTVDYAKTRVQFGRAIGSFQALKHRMADMLARTELARSASWAASYTLDAEAVHAAASYALEAASHNASECIQLHGGIAITWEHDAHIVFKRAHALQQLAGAPHQHRAAISL